ncbi:hypothetical protein O7627_32745 [Solwaraspora sp. WMMD1047]|uniref:hypothetical protein n=1 Tax=Solwaraspora sp. WMMD1047 TaxID=3016102 RepID=UPI002417DA84|nr:hypothetical protein [Solwaraspora sp. WMMD1047]MDG4834038.1 hypothetical protein [Solwaraspora sp. WMMD1047]
MFQQTAAAPRLKAGRPAPGELRRPGERVRRRRSTGRARALGAVLALVIGLALAGCGGGSDDASGVASVGDGGAGVASASPAAELSEDERRLKFAECLRGQGLDVPDPEPGQRGPRFNFGEDVDPQQVRAAAEACREFAPNGGEGVQLDPEQVEAVRELAKCMRENGVPDFPDPAADGRIQLGQGDIDPQDPAVRAAFEKCQEFMPNLGRRGGGS